MSTGLLVASPQMVDIFFSKTVVLLCEYNEDGAIGIVVVGRVELRRASGRRRSPMRTQCARAATCTAVGRHLRNADSHILDPPFAGVAASPAILWSP